MNNEIIGQLYIKIKVQLFNFDTTETDPVYNNSLWMDRSGTDIKATPFTGGTTTSNVFVGGLVDSDSATVTAATDLTIAIPGTAAQATSIWLMYFVTGTGLNVSHSAEADPEGRSFTFSQNKSAVNSTTLAVGLCLLDMSDVNSGCYGIFRISTSSSTTVTRVYMIMVPWEPTTYAYTMGIGGFKKIGDTRQGGVFLRPKIGETNDQFRKNIMATGRKAVIDRLQPALPTKDSISDKQRLSKALMEILGDPPMEPLKPSKKTTDNDSDDDGLISVGTRSLSDLCSRFNRTEDLRSAGSRATITSSKK
jgi:hypothetical protein